ncbi:MAG: N-acetyltransferase [Desulfuromonadales bacterium]|nr:N-acetyltransferase [Desulfuromonadales bacterium]
MVRSAKISDARTIHQLLLNYASDGLMLPRSLSDLYENIRDFYVYEEADGTVIGAVCLHISWEDLAEVRSLAVAEQASRRGVGRQLVEQCLAEARAIGIKKVFALTYKVDFFVKLGFCEIEKSELPHKIWGDCIKCAKFPECDETAMQITV